MGITFTKSKRKPIQIEERVCDFHLSKLKLEDMPDEIILKVLSYLDLLNLIRCGQLSMRIRSISHDRSLWQKVDLQNWNWHWNRWTSINPPRRKRVEDLYQLVPIGTVCTLAITALEL